MKRFLATAIVGFALVLGGSNAYALDQTSPEYLGLVVDGIPSNPADEVTYINSLLQVANNTLDPQCNLATTEVCDRTGSFLNTAGLPLATTTGSFKDETDPPTSIDVTGWAYLLGKYDAANAGSLVWYVGDLSGIQTLPGSFNGHELSHLSLYNPGGTSVPDGGATLGLLGLGMLGLGYLRRRQQR